MIPDIDYSIIRLLADDGRMSNTEIARRLGVSEATVRQRIKQLVESGKIRVTSQVNVDSFSDIFYALISIVVSKEQEGCMELFA